MIWDLAKARKTEGGERVDVVSPMLWDWELSLTISYSYGKMRKKKKEGGNPEILSESGSHLVVSKSLWPHGLSSPRNSPGQNPGVGSLSFLKGIFPTQGSNPGLPHCRRIPYQLSHNGSPHLSERVIKRRSLNLKLSNDDLSIILAQVSITNNQRPGGLNNRSVFLIVLEAGKSKSKVWQGGFHPEASSLGLQRAGILLCAHMALSCVFEEREQLSGISPYEDICPIRPGSHPYQST